MSRLGGRRAVYVYRSVVGALAVSALLALIVLQLRDEVDPDVTTLVLVGIVLALMATLMMPRETASFLRRITRLKAGGFEIEIGATESRRAERVVRALPPHGDGVPVPRRPRTGDDVVDLLRVKTYVQQRLRFLRDTLGRTDYEFDYIDMLAYLHKEELLNTDEVRVAKDVLAEDISPAWAAADRERFLDAAWPFGRRLAAEVWDRHVRKELREAGWCIEEFRQKRDHRPDFVARRGTEVIVAAARVADPWDTLEPARERLSGARQAPEDVQRRVVIIPDVRVQSDQKFPSVEVVGLRSLAPKTK